MPSRSCATACAVCANRTRHTHQLSPLLQSVLARRIGVPYGRSCYEVRMRESLLARQAFRGVELKEFLEEVEG